MRFRYAVHMRTTISLEDRLAQQVRRRAEEEGLSVSAFIARTLDDALKRMAPQSSPPFRLVTVKGEGFTPKSNSIAQGPLSPRTMRRSLPGSRASADAPPRRECLDLRPSGGFDFGSSTLRGMVDPARHRATAVRPFRAHTFRTRQDRETDASSSVPRRWTRCLPSRQSSSDDPLPGSSLQAPTISRSSSSSVESRMRPANWSPTRSTPQWRSSTAVRW